MTQFKHSIYARKFPCENYIAKIDRKTYDLYESYVVFEYHDKLLLTDGRYFSKNNSKFWLFDTQAQSLVRILTYEEANVMRERYEAIKRERWLKNSDTDYLRERVDRAKRELEKAQAKYQKALEEYEQAIKSQA